MKVQKNVFSLCLLALLACLLTACSDQQQEKNNSKSSVASHLEQFSKISLKGNIRAIIEHAPNRSISLKAEKEILPLITVKVIDDTLYVHAEKSTSTMSSHSRVHIYIDSIKKIITSGNTYIRAKSLTLEMLEIENYGSSKFDISGHINKLDIKTIGALRLNGQQLKTKTTLVDSKGVNNLIIQTSENLTISSNGFNKVLYTGSPKIKASISGYNIIKLINRS